jgi:hypothetical protein
MAAALESKFVTVEGVRLHYQEVGCGYGDLHPRSRPGAAQEQFQVEHSGVRAKFRRSSF